MGYFDGVNHRLLEYIPLSAQLILEIGCAKGALGQIVKERQPCEYWGLDQHRPSIEIASDHLDHAICLDVEDESPLPLPNTYFDCLVFGDVLEHLRNPENLLRKLKQHLAPNCTLAVNVPNVAHWTVLEQLLSGNFEYSDSGILDRTHLRFFTPGSFRTMLWEVGFVPTAVKYLTIPPGRPIDWSAPCTALGLSSEIASAVTDVYQFTYQASLVSATLDSIRGPGVGSLEEATTAGSVIVVTYNSATTITECLRSVLETTTPDVEVIVVDNDSRDRTLALVRALNSDRIRIIESPENLGYSKAANLGFRASQGSVLIALNPDCETFPGWYESMVSALSGAGVAAAGPLSDCVAGDQFVEYHLPRNLRPPLEELCTILGSHNRGAVSSTKLLVGFCLATKRSLLNEVGLFDEAMILGSEDLEFSWRCRQFGYQLLICKDAFVRHHQGVSFASKKDGSAERQVAQSHRALLRKLTGYYRDLTHLRSSDLWGCGVFDSVLERWS